MNPTRLGVGVIGAGKVGPVFAQALAGAGHAMVGITKPSDGDTDRLHAVVPGVALKEPLEIIALSELVIIAIPDSEVAGFVEGVSKAHGWRRGQIVAHTSISHGLDVLDSATEAGVIPLTLHPLMEFTGTSMDIARMSQAWCVVGSPPVAAPIASALAVEMGMEPLSVQDEHRSLVASAIALATSFSHTTIAEAASRLESAGITNPGVVLSALVNSSVDNALRSVAGNDVERGQQ
jgi:predicted short-subunit dehydrogenase-like oxidoreductase (DUF2520 family)